MYEHFGIKGNEIFTTLLVTTAPTELQAHAHN